MNNAHLHLLVNHFPIICTLIGLLIIIIGIFTKSLHVQRVAYFVLILSAIFTVVSLQTGEGAEKVIEHLNIADHHIIHEHEEAAETFALMSYLLGALSIAGMWLSKKKYATLTAIIIAVLSAVTFYFSTVVGNTGGQIRHTEIREDAPEAVSE